MTEGDYFTQSRPLPAPPQRHSRKPYILAFACACGFLCGVLATWSLLPAPVDSGHVNLLLLSSFLPLVAGIVLADRRGSPTRRGVGMALVAGWLTMLFLVIAYFVVAFSIACHNSSGVLC